MTIWTCSALYRLGDARIDDEQVAVVAAHCFDGKKLVLCGAGLFVEKGSLRSGRLAIGVVVPLALAAAPSTRKCKSFSVTLGIFATVA